MLFALFLKEILGNFWSSHKAGKKVYKSFIVKNFKFNWVNLLSVFVHFALKFRLPSKTTNSFHKNFYCNTSFCNPFSLRRCQKAQFVLDFVNAEIHFSSPLRKDRVQFSHKGLNQELSTGRVIDWTTICFLLCIWILNHQKCEKCANSFDETQFSKSQLSVITGLISRIKVLINLFKHMEAYATKTSPRLFLASESWRNGNAKKVFLPGNAANLISSNKVWTEKF